MVHIRGNRLVHDQGNQVVHFAGNPTINRWFNGEAGKVVVGTEVQNTIRTIGFSSWTTSQGRIEYVQSTNIASGEFFVPRVIESQKLERRPREKIDRHFPKKDDGSSVAAHLALKLSKNGAAAIFCGVKATAHSITEKILEAYSRGLALPPPSTFADEHELNQISHLYGLHFGADALEGVAARLGILNHHASIPNGIRLASEYALRERLANFVICTSTLAQGVNLPLRYLIFTSIYQAGERLKVRDFHNLIGRAGRSGFQTEGTILFADPEVYDKRVGKEGWRFRSVGELMNISNSEPCLSTLLSIFAPFHNAKRDMTYEYEVMQLFRDFFVDETAIDAFVNEIVAAHSGSGFDEKTVRKQVSWKLKIYTAIESYLIATLQDVPLEERGAFAKNLAAQTFAYDLASAEQKTSLQELFALVSERVDSKVALDSTKRTYGRTLLGLADLIDLDDWISNHADQIADCIDDGDRFFELVLPLIERFMEGSDLLKIRSLAARARLAKIWISGVPYHEMLTELTESGAFLQAGTKKYSLSLHHLVDICEGELGFQGMLLLGALAELFDNNPSYTDTIVGDLLRSLQKRLRYGLSEELEVQIYEFASGDPGGHTKSGQLRPGQNRPVGWQDI